MWIILPGVKEGEECLRNTSGLWKSKILCMMVTISIITTFYTFTTFSKWDKSSKASVGHQAKASFTASSAEPVLMTQTLETGADGLVWESFGSLSLHDDPLNTTTLKKCWLFNEAILGSKSYLDIKETIYSISLAWRKKPNVGVCRMLGNNKRLSTQSWEESKSEYDVIVSSLKYFLSVSMVWSRLQIFNVSALVEIQFLVL